MIPQDWLVAPLDDEPAMGPYDGQRRAHNAAMRSFRLEMLGKSSGLRQHERGLLTLAWGIEMFAGSWIDQVDHLSADYMWDIVRAFRYLLNHNIGRLDGGTCATWATSILERWGIDPDTGDWAPVEGLM